MINIWCCSELWPQFLCWGLFRVPVAMFAVHRPAAVMPEGSSWRRLVLLIHACFLWTSSRAGKLFYRYYLANVIHPVDCLLSWLIFCSRTCIDRSRLLLLMMILLPMLPPPHRRLRPQSHNPNEQNRHRDYSFDPCNKRQLLDGGRSDGGQARVAIVRVLLLTADTRLSVARVSRVP